MSFACDRIDLGRNSEMCILVCLYPADQINGQVLYGKTHQNASSIIKCAPSKVKIIFIR